MKICPGCCYEEQVLDGEPQGYYRRVGLVWSQLITLNSLVWFLAQLMRLCDDVVAFLPQLIRSYSSLVWFLPQFSSNIFV